MTNYAKQKERTAIYKEYRENCRVYKNEWVEITECQGFGDFIGTGRYRMARLWDRDMTMEEWNPEKAERYKQLKAELAEYEAEQARKAKIRRYERELERLEERKAYLEKWLADNK